MGATAGERQHRYHALVLDSIAEGICGIDPGGTVTFANPAAAGMLHSRPDALVGRSLHDVVHTGAAPAHRAGECPLTDPVRTGGVRAGQDCFLRASGDELPVDFTSSALLDGEIEGGVVSFRKAGDQLRSATTLAEGREQRDRLLAWIVDAQQEERQRIAADIHDDTVQVMGAVSLRLELALGRLQDPEQRNLLAELRDTVDEASDRLRALLFQLIPPDLDRDLAGAIDVHGRHLAEEGGFTHELREDFERQPPHSHGETIFRLAHELLVNVRKHAAATHVVTTIGTHGGGYRLRVEDDGAGIAAERLREGDSQHAGLRLIRDRVALAGGRWSIGARDEGGTIVEIWLPSEDAR